MNEQTQREAETRGSFQLQAYVHEVLLCTADKVLLSRSSLRDLASLRYSRTACYWSLSFVAELRSRGIESMFVCKNMQTGQAKIAKTKQHDA